jgi:hypothetical protein
MYLYSWAAREAMYGSPETKYLVFGVSLRLSFAELLGNLLGSSSDPS